MRFRLALALAVLLAPAAPSLPARAEPPLRLLLANVGNSNVHCQPYAFKLCFRSVEERVAAGIAAADADIVALIEVLPRARCASAYGGLPEPDPQKSCSPLHEWPEGMEHQVRRLVGPGYAIACDARFGWDCLAVRADRLTVLVEGCENACLVVHGLQTAPAIDGCDPGFTVSAADVGVGAGAPLRIVLGHPDSGFASGAGGASCRLQQLEQAFAFGSPGTTILAGDWNMDPYRRNGDDVDLWRAQVGLEGQRYLLHSGAAEPGAPSPPHVTHFAGESSNLLPTGELLPVVAEDPSGAFARTTIDHVASDAATGTCVTLGEQPGTARLDGGPGGGMDHRALLCELTLR